MIPAARLAGDWRILLVIRATRCGKCDEKRSETSAEFMSLNDISDVFEKATEIDDPQRQKEFVLNACKDQEGREQLLSLLNAHRATCNLVDAPDHILKSARELDSDEHQVREGDRIGPYRLLEKIGEGGMGCVFMADQMSPIKRRVAIKVIKRTAGSDQIIARFEAERQALSRLDHPNITRIVDAGVTEKGIPYFVMELVCGESIIEFCDRNKLGIRERIALLQKVCLAVHHAHQKGILHRDIKPSNVMVTVQDGEPVPKVIDFGIAKALDQPLTEKTLFTRYGEMIGTPQYMSPEQAEQGGQDLDIRTDIYSLGVLLYKLLTGSTPIENATLEGKGILGILETVRDSESESPSCRVTRTMSQNETIAEYRGTQNYLLKRILKGELDWITLKAIAKVRNERYDSAAAMAADIGRHLNGEPILAAAPTFLYLASKILHRHRAICVAAATSAALLILATVAATGWAISNQRLAEKSANLVEANNELRKANELASSSQKQAVRLADEKKAQAAFERAANRHLLGSLDGLLGNTPKIKVDQNFSDADLVKSLGSVLKELGDAMEGGAIEDLEEQLENFLKEEVQGLENFEATTEVSSQKFGVVQGSFHHNDTKFMKILLEELHKELGSDHVIVASTLVRFCSVCLQNENPNWSEIEGRARESLAILSSKEEDSDIVFLKLQSEAALTRALEQQGRTFESEKIKKRLLPYLEQQSSNLSVKQRHAIEQWIGATN